jgi:hypothetical protein
LSLQNSLNKLHKPRSMEQWLAGDRAMPRSATALLCWSLYALGKLPIDDVLMWHHRDVLAGFR